MISRLIKRLIILSLNGRSRRTSNRAAAPMPTVVQPVILKLPTSVRSLSPTSSGETGVLSLVKKASRRVLYYPLAWINNPGRK